MVSPSLCKFRSVVRGEYLFAYYKYIKFFGILAIMTCKHTSIKRVSNFIWKCNVMIEFQWASEFKFAKICRQNIDRRLDDYR